MTTQPHAAGLAIAELKCADDRHLAPARATRPAAWRLGLGALQQAGLVDLAQPGERQPLEFDHRPAQLARQQLGGLVWADPELPPPSCRAEMPLECVAVRWVAQKQVVSGRSEWCVTVPAVTEVSLRHAVHSRECCNRGG